MSKQYDYLVMIGRFQPFHNGHLEVLKIAASQAKHVIVIVGSSNSARNIKNPFDDSERLFMIQDSIQDIKRENLHIRFVEDDLYNFNKWVENVQVQVEAVTSTINAGNRIGLIGHFKDQSSFYLKKFAQWGNNYYETGNFENGLNATQIRNMYFQNDQIYNIFEKEIKSKLPKGTISLLNTFRNTSSYKHLKEEFDFISKYKQRWDSAPYTPTFVTTDAVVVKDGHALLIERGDMPGKGLLALPGGFVEQNETLYDSVLRELREETKLKVPLPVLDHSNAGISKVFDHPSRSLRGRTITHAFYFNLDRGDTSLGLPKVKASSDAKKAFWMPFKEISENKNKFYEDHFHILTYFLNQ